ncbi:MAG: hypothetical protein VX938_08045, partial [Myxococcota bacterium]|nr:hypothetical protein [Myxococcota bacterium]
MTGQTSVGDCALRLVAWMPILVLVVGCTSSDVESGNVTDASPATSTDIPSATDDTADSGTLSPETTPPEPDVEPPPPPPTDQSQWPPCETGGEAGCPCETVDDCHSGWCVTTGEGKMCTVTCDSVCPAGWQCTDVVSGGSDLTYICAPMYTHLCRPCETGEDCSQLGGLGGFCLPDPSGAGSFCGGNCSDDSPCPAGYECAEVPIGSTSTANQCIPEGGAPCECNDLAAKDGASTVCAMANEHGACD